MWALFKSFVGAVFFVALAYVVFFVPVGQQTLAGHVGDIWGTPVVQDKVGRVKDSVRRELEERVAAVAEESARQAVRSAGEDEFREDDRAKLDEVIGGP